ncbi:MAG: MaoC family dehydratase N-terminal domain-containing protein [Aquisalimonadaceae bacterium]
MSLNIAQLQEWIGSTETLEDTLTATPVAAMSATIDRQDPPSTAGTELPLLWHWLYFLPLHRHSELGPDGHAERGGFLPPVPLPRRMWAGGRLQFHQPLRVGDNVTRVSRIADVSAKEGRSGTLAFVRVRHEISNGGGLAVTEDHNIVYRNMPAPGDPPPVPPQAPGQSAWSRKITPDPVLLFRYSALTFNGHRIHYDRSYVTDVEGYPGLIVHGPLIATLLLDLLRRNLPDAWVVGFSYRAVSPVFDIESFSVCGAPETAGGSVRLWAENARGGLVMEATAELSPREER